MPKKMSPKQYLNALTQIEVQRIGFQEICSKLHVENFAEGEITVEVKNQVEIQPDEKNGTFLAIDIYTVSGLVKGKPLFEIKLRIIVAIHSKVTSDKEFIEIFERNTLKVITYPYVRHEVQDLTSKMGLPPFIMPMWRVPAKANKDYLRPSSKEP
jgi:preprotein translocase subunit SecB